MLDNRQFINRLIRKIAFLSFPILVIVFTACEAAKNDNIPEKITETEAPIIEEEIVLVESDLSTTNFIKNLEKGSNIAGFFNENWTFAYIEDNRIDGSITGEIENLKKSQINEIITLSVYSSGEGWDEIPNEPKTYDLDFQLKNRFEYWDRFEIEEIGTPKKNTVYVGGSGQSEYIKVVYNTDNLIIRLEYHQEDPG